MNDFAPYATHALHAFDALPEMDKWGVAFGVRYERCRDPLEKTALIQAFRACGVQGSTYTPLIATLGRAMRRVA